VDATLFRKIRPTLEGAREGLSACFRSLQPAPGGVYSSHVDVMQHTVSDVIHNQCGHTAML